MMNKLLEENTELRIAVLSLLTSLSKYDGFKMPKMNFNFPMAQLNEIIRDLGGINFTVESCTGVDYEKNINKGGLKCDALK